MIEKTVKLECIADTYIDDHNPDMNFGNNPTLWLYSGVAVGGLIVVGLLLKSKGGMSISILPPIRESQTINKNGEQF